MMIIEHDGALLLEQRPAPGVWGGLWCFPEIDSRADVTAACAQRYGVEVGTVEAMNPVEHGFTHFKLTIMPLRVQALGITPRTGETAYRWIDIADVGACAIPAPVRSMVGTLASGFALRLS